MRLANGIFMEKEEVNATFGEVKFSALRRENHGRNEDGSVSEEVISRTYDLKSKTQGRMIQVTLPAEVPLKDFSYNADVEIINLVVDTAANHTFGNSATVDWYAKADDIQLKKSAVPSGNSQPPKQNNNPHDKQ